MYGLQIVLLLALFVCAYMFLWQKKSRGPQTYDVFLSFRGDDTRTGFTDHLYNGLEAVGFHVFRDDETLRAGEKIEKELVQAIRSCRIVIPIISKNYAKSRWCLRELTETMNCHDKHNKRVFPVFYKVDVLDLRGPSGRFADDLSEHKATCREESPQWTKALTSVGWIRGWTSQTIANGLDGELVKMVVERVSSELQTMWIERLPIFPMLMSNYHIRSAYDYFSEKIRGEVFLAFHGPDTRLGFTACLYSSLVGAGIRVLKDDHPYLIGTHLKHGIFNAINHCKISIPILSVNFASSPWCLEDLKMMVDCKRRKGQKILPIFYKVQPLDVKNISNQFGRPMRKHRKEISSKVYGQWEEALKEVGSFKGWESEKEANGNEGELLKKVVKQVLTLLTNPQKLDSS
ncbi:hypothetical protein ACJRO7_017740 [Eucalyptus globulus]|uniref:ADP-ribosyl cyclase/cyclic ADP-ribose hydrolase n=1 Tax=Eucalyptus globulus TaxID=34317 RepID=A0ABD3L2C7_EUCGL